MKCFASIFSLASVAICMIPFTVSGTSSYAPLVSLSDTNIIGTKSCSQEEWSSVLDTMRHIVPPQVALEAEMLRLNHFCHIAGHGPCDQSVSPGFNTTASLSEAGSSQAKSRGLRGVAERSLQRYCQYIGGGLCFRGNTTRPSTRALQEQLPVGRAAVDAILCEAEIGMMNNLLDTLMPSLSHECLTLIGAPRTYECLHV